MKHLNYSNSNKELYKSNIYKDSGTDITTIKVLIFAETIDIANLIIEDMTKFHQAIDENIELNGCCGIILN